MIAIKMNENPQKVIDHTYQIRGFGGQGACMAVQSVLQEHGLCGYTVWISPGWHFLYLTHLEPPDVMHMLGDLGRRFEITIENSNVDL